MRLHHYIILCLGILGLAAPAQAAIFAAVPPSLSYANTGTGACSQSQQVKFTNVSGAQQSVDQIIIAGTNPGDFGITATEPANLDQMGMGISVPNNFVITVSVRFCPIAGGPRAGILRLRLANGMSGADVNLAGTAIGPKLTVTPNPINAGGSKLNVTSTITNIIVGNSGGGTVVVTQLTLLGANASEFKIVKPCNNADACALAATLGPGNQGAFEVQLTYTPTFQGTHNATLRIANNDPNFGPTLDVPIQGKAGDPAIAASPSNVAFSNTRVGLTSMAQPVTITNVGNSNLVINNITIDMAGNPNDWTLDLMGAVFPLTLSVGQTKDFSVSFKPTATGNRSGRVAIQSNDPNTPIKFVNMLGAGTISMLSVAPGSLNFGEQVLYKGSSPQSVIITNAGTDDANITAFSFDGNKNMMMSSFRYNGLQMPPIKVPAMGSYKFDVIALPLLKDKVTDVLHLVTDDPKTPEFTVSLSVTGTAAAVMVDPPFGDFGRVNLNGMKTITFTISNTGTADLSIETVNLLDMNNVFNIDVKMLKDLPYKLLKGQAVDFDVTFTPNGAVSAFSGEVDLDFTGDPMSSHIHIPLDGQGEQAGFSVSAGGMTTINFGSWISGQQSPPQNVTIKNTGMEPIHIKSVVLGGNNPNQFTLVDDDIMSLAKGFDLPAMKDRLVPVFYSPMTPGMHSAKLIVTADGFNTPSQVTLTGTAVQPILNVDSQHKSIDFGTNLVNFPSSPVTVGLQVPANAQTGVTISGIISKNPDFWVDTSKTQLSLTPGGTTTFDVIFVPTKIEPNPHSGVIEISVRGINGPIAMVNAKGTAYQSIVTTMMTPGSGCRVSGQSSSSGDLLLLALPGVAMLLRRRRRNRIQPSC